MTRNQIEKNRLISRNIIKYSGGILLAYLIIILTPCLISFLINLN